MKIGILGSGPSALYSALYILERHPEAEIEIFEKEEKLGKKFRATGNGRGNLLPVELDPSAYNDFAFMEALIKRFSMDRCIKALLRCGIYLEGIPGQGYYPISLSANVHVEYLLEQLSHLGVLYRTGKRVVDYESSEKGCSLMLDGGRKVSFDALILAPGGASGKNLGSDGAFLEVFSRHGYKTHAFRPGLCPMRLEDPDIRPLSGLRHGVSLKVLCDKKPIFEEAGELLYKDDGLSGIVTMNASSAIARRKGKGKYQILVDLLPNWSVPLLAQELHRVELLSGLPPLRAFFPKPLADHIERRARSEKWKSRYEALAESAKNLAYDYRENYPFAYSQVSVGGMDLSEIGKNFESKREPNVYILGEVLNIDGNCGGYNLYFDLASALAVAESI